MTPVKWEARVRGKPPSAWREVMPTKTEPTVEARVEYLKTIKSWDGEQVYEFRALYEAPPEFAERERWKALLAEVSKQTRHPDYDWPACLQREVDEALKA